jgi:uncharacterized protein with GYD domain
MSYIDLLLETDVEKLKTNKQKKYEVKRLSKVLGEKFVITCVPLTQEQIVHIGEVAKDNADVKLHAMVEACRIDGKKFNDKRLLEKFNVVAAKDVIKTLFLPGEIAEVYGLINDLSGFSKDAVTEVKN